MGPREESRRNAVETRNPEVTEFKILNSLDRKGFIENIYRQLPTPNEEKLTSTEGMYIQLYTSKVIEWITYRPLGTASGSRQSPAEHFMLRRFGPSLSSKPVRYAVILLSIQYQGLIDSEQLLHAEYLDLFCRNTRTAIDYKSYADIVYACYTVCLYDILSRRPFDQVAMHFKGFLSSLENFMHFSESSSENPPKGEIQSIRNVYCNLAGWLLLSLNTQREVPRLAEITNLAVKVEQTADIGFENESYNFMMTLDYEAIQIRLYLLKLFVNYALLSVDRKSLATIDQEMRLELRRQLRRLGRILLLPRTCAGQILKNLELFETLPENMEFTLQQTSANIIELDRDLRWRLSLMQYCSLYLRYVILFEESVAIEDVSFDETIAAITLCRLIVIEYGIITSYKSSPSLTTRRLWTHQLFLAGLTLAKGHRYNRAILCFLC